MLEEEEEKKTDLYYKLSFSSVHKHKVLLVYAVGYRKGRKRAVGKQSSGSNGDSEERKDEAKKKENEQENMLLIIVCQKRTAYSEQRK
jgi:hypothetical protein